ncbi:MAG: YqzL family protein [bacterium]|jgi:hypothetical protein
MQESHDVLWRLFQATGHIGAYLFYKTLVTEENGSNEGGNEQDQYC